MAESPKTSSRRMKIGLIAGLEENGFGGKTPHYCDLQALALAAEQVGFDSFWLADHFIYRTPDEEVGQWEVFTFLAGIAAATSRIAVGPLVACTSFREPALLAKMADSLDEISEGRFILGLGAGWHEPEYRAFGFPFDHRVDRFAESIEITATLLRDGRASVAGRYYAVTDCPLLPARADGGTVPILVGCGGGERMMALTARWADAWNGAWYGRPGAKFHELRAKLHEACEAIGRDPSTVEITIGMIMGEPAPRVPVNADAVAQALGEWHDAGVAHVIGLPDPTNQAGVEALCEGARQFRSA